MFLISPVIYLFTGISAGVGVVYPFYLPFTLFYCLQTAAFMFGAWGISAAWDGRGPLTSPFFSMNLRALDTVCAGQIKFHVTPEERQTGRFSLSHQAANCHRLLTLAGG